MSDAGGIERRELAEKFDRYARHTALAIVPIGVIAVVDLLTGWLTGDRRIDTALLAASALSVWGALSMRRLAKRFRTGDFQTRPTPEHWVRSIASLVVTLSVSAGIGYLLGGWVVAAVLPSVTTVLMAVSILLGLRRRRLARNTESV